MTTMTSKAWLLIAYIIVLPLASPFVHAGTIAPNSHKKSAQFTPSNKSHVTPPPLSAANNKAAILMQPNGNGHGHGHDAGTATATATATAEKYSQEKLPKETTAIKDGAAPRGEHDSNLISRLLYCYVAPLIKISSQRQLEETDVFPTPDSIKMDKQVPELERIYNRCKAKAHYHLENLQSSSAETKDKTIKKRLDERVAKSESLILAKALLLHQKRNIIVTGLLRLLNTAVQAFPAILVARLLRLIEAGDTAHPSKAIRAALELVAILSIKMVIENQYFHNIIKASTMVRGSLAGLIFDKSLKVSANAGHLGDSMAGHGDNDKNGENDMKSSIGSSSVLNLMQSDVSIIESMALQIHTIWGELLYCYCYC